MNHMLSVIIEPSASGEPQPFRQMLAAHFHEHLRAIPLPAFAAEGISEEESRQFMLRRKIMKFMDQELSNQQEQFGPGPAHVAEFNAKVSNLLKELMRDEMSWNTFVKGMSVLNRTIIITTHPKE